MDGSLCGAQETVKLMITRRNPVKGPVVNNVLGLAFKQNFADLRNARVIDVIRELETYGVGRGPRSGRQQERNCKSALSPI
jgi:UDP-N-acetyl-D-mannosaminuronate dehydrogenase